MDSGVLFGSKEMIEQRVRETAKAAKDMGVRHVMNLGHGIMQASRGAAASWPALASRVCASPRPWLLFAC
jgi:uroporphyrinogen-III decarboxylase